MQPDIIEPPMTAYDHLSAHQRSLRAAQGLLATATTDRDRSMYNVMIINAERHCAHWQKKVDEIHEESH